MNGKSQNALRLVCALCISLAFHGLLFYAGQRWLVLAAPASPLPPVLYARLELPPEPEADTLPLKNTMKEEPTPEPADKPRRSGRDSAALPRASPPAAEPAPEDASLDLLYPPEALALGLEGEPVLLVEVDEASRIIGVSIGSSSGHPILDQAALKKVWALGRLEGHRSKTLLFPVKFKLQ